MSLRLYLIIMFIATGLCWLAFIFIIRTVNPEITNWVGFVLFYLSLFLSLVGSFSLVGFLVRFIGLKREFINYSVKAAFRQAFLFSFCIISVLFLLAANLFSWLNVVLLVVGLSVLEFFIISYGRRGILPEDDSLAHNT